MADFSVVWSVRVALALYVLALVLRLRAAGRLPWLNAARIAWTIGYLCFLAHLAAAFHFVHHWSHAAAYEETARQTEEALGFAFGGGVFVNYAFTLVWGEDAVWWWLSPATYLQRPRWIEWAVQSFLGFVAFNSTAVFGHGAIRWVGWAACLVLVFCGLIVPRTDHTLVSAED